MAESNASVLAMEALVLWHAGPSAKPGSSLGPSATAGQQASSMLQSKVMWGQWEVCLTNTKAQTVASLGVLVLLRSAWFLTVFLCKVVAVFLRMILYFLCIWRFFTSQYLCNLFFLKSHFHKTYFLIFSIGKCRENYGYKTTCINRTKETIKKKRKLSLQVYDKRSWSNEA